MAAHPTDDTTLMMPKVMVWEWPAAGEADCGSGLRKQWGREVGCKCSMLGSRLFTDKAVHARFALIGLPCTGTCSPPSSADRPVPSLPSARTDINFTYMLAFRQETITPQ